MSIETELEQDLLQLVRRQSYERSEPYQDRKNYSHMLKWQKKKGNSFLSQTHRGVV